MRTTMTLILTVLLSLGFAVTSFASIEGTKHDLSATGQGGGATMQSENSTDSTTYATAEICIYCHTPHQATTATLDYNPLWNMAVSAVSYAAYTSATFDGEATQNVDPFVGPSRLCMSCHDGVIAVDSAIGGTDAIASGKIIGNATNGMGSDHPIGFDYTAVAVTLDDEIYVATGTAMGATGNDIVDYLSGGTIMTCATCHDVHDDTLGNFLLVNNDNSDLCLTCHNK